MILIEWYSHNDTNSCCRFLKKNMILGALWFSSEKPTMATFLRPLIDSLNNLYLKGIWIKVAYIAQPSLCDEAVHTL